MSASMPPKGAEVLGWDDLLESRPSHDAGAAYLMSSNRRAIKLKTIVWGIQSPVVFAFFVLRLGMAANSYRSRKMGQKCLTTLRGSDLFLARSVQNRLP